MIHFTHEEFQARIARTREAMAERDLDAMLLFAPESHYWLTGYDTFGFCFFQCMVLPAKGEPILLTRSADLRQARHTSIVEDIRIWADGADANGARDLKAILKELKLMDGARLGVELATQGLTAANWRMVKGVLRAKKKRPALIDASRLVDDLRLVKSEAEIACARRAAEPPSSVAMVPSTSMRTGSFSPRMASRSRTISPARSARASAFGPA